MEIPKEHQLKCAGCGEMLDKRDASVLSHGWIQDGEIVCYGDKVEYNSSRNIGCPTQWTKNKQSINLN